MRSRPDGPLRTSGTPHCTVCFRRACCRYDSDHVGQLRCACKRSLRCRLRRLSGLSGLGAAMGRLSNCLFGERGKTGIQGANLWSRTVFAWSGPLIRKGWTTTLEEPDAASLVPDWDNAEPLAKQFDQAYVAAKVSYNTCAVAPAVL